jgi:lipoprotein Spr
MNQVSISVQPVVETDALPNYSVIDKVEIINSKENKIYSSTTDIEQFIPAAFRFSLLLDIEVEALKNRTLFDYIYRWWATPYRIGGNSMAGVDCSGFIKGLTLEAFEKELPRTSREQSDVCASVSKDELKEGDLVFFKTSRGGISHVGMYLTNNKFVHASTSVGVTISDLNEVYWKKRLVKIGRITS